MCCAAVGLCIRRYAVERETSARLAVVWLSYCFFFCYFLMCGFVFFFFFQAEDGIRDLIVTGVQTCALPIFLLERIRNGDVCPLHETTRGNIKRRYVHDDIGLDLPVIARPLNRRRSILRLSLDRKSVV